MRGDELTPWLIRYGYEQGAFPMTMEDGEVEWFQPRYRALFPIKGIHVSKSMRKVLRNTSVAAEVASQQISTSQAPSSKTSQFGEGGFIVTFDRAFEQVIRGCLRPDGNWISEDFIRVYSEIHEQGWGHSVEVWQTDTGTIGGNADLPNMGPVELSGDGVPASPDDLPIGGTPMLRHGRMHLIGGLYGITLGSCFCAESMFHRATNASKVALWAMVERCRSRGFTIFDAQIMNPHLKSLGAYSMSHSAYMRMLRSALEQRTTWS